MEEIDLKELFNIFWEKKIQIIAVVIIFAIIGVIYSSQIKTPIYSSSTSLVLVQSQGDNASSITSSDITLNSKLVSTYSEIIKSTTTVREVISNLGLDLEEEDVKKDIKVTAVDGTEVIKITVSNEDAVVAYKIANEIANVFINRAKAIYKIENVQVLDLAEVAEGPSNINHIKDVAIFMFIGVVISCAYVLLLNMLDNTIKSQEDAEKALKVPVLASIPVYNPEANKGGKM